MAHAQLAILPVIDGRSTERRIVNLAARLREPGAQIVDAEVRDLSTDGFMAETELALEPGAIVWLKLPGLEPQNSKVVWAEEGKIGFQFTTPVHPATIELVVAMSRKPVPKRHFGPQDRPGPRSIA
ncbi:MAG TPA: PilZ domain-containing protein [Allosphingosinicella sp.]|nr:PilZ domain-containing protein [Allosphingosinicella sp.]